MKASIHHRPIPGHHDTTLAIEPLTRLGGLLVFPLENSCLPASADHIGGSFSTSMAPWHLHSQVAASFSRQLLMLIARYQATAKQSTEDIEVSPSPAEPNTFGFSLTEGSYSESIAGQAPPPPSSRVVPVMLIVWFLRSRRPRIACLA